MVRPIRLGGEVLYKQLLMPLDETLEILTGKKREFIMLGGAIATSMFLFKLLMQNLIPNIAELFTVWLIMCITIIMLFILIRRVNYKARKRNISGIVAALIPLLILVLLL